MQVWSFLKKCNWSVLPIIPMWYVIGCAIGYFTIEVSADGLQRLQQLYTDEPTYMLWIFYSLIPVVISVFFIRWLSQAAQDRLKGYILAIQASVLFHFFLMLNDKPNVVVMLLIGMTTYLLISATSLATTNQLEAT